MMRLLVERRWVERYPQEHTWLAQQFATAGVPTVVSDAPQESHASLEYKGTCIIHQPLSATGMDREQLKKWLALAWESSGYYLMPGQQIGEHP